MSSADAVAILCFGCFGWMILSFAFAASGQRDSSLRVADDRSQVVFRKRLGERLFGAMMCVFISVGVALQYGQGVIYAVQRHQPVPDIAYFALLLGVLIGGGLGGPFFYLSGPRVQAGPWEDMAGVYVRSYGGGDRGTSYIVEIAWRRERLACPMLGCFTFESRATALADEVSTALSLPRVAPPPKGKTSVDPARATLPS